MTHVIAEPCIGTKSADCVEVCPVNCIHDGGELYYIDPAVCIDCGSCVSVCPVEAIFPEADVPAQWKGYTEKNAKMSRGEAVAAGTPPAGAGAEAVASAAEAPPQGAKAPAVAANTESAATEPEGSGDFSPRAPTSPLSVRRVKELAARGRK